VVLAEERAVDVADLASADGLCRASVGREATLSWLVVWTCLVLAVRAQRPELVQLKRACAQRRQLHSTVAPHASSLSSFHNSG